MNSRNLALIIDGSQAAADFRADLVFEQWGTDKKIIKRTNRFAESAKPSLFSSDVATRLYLENADAAKQITKVLEENASQDNYDFIYSGFLIIASNIHRNSTKKLEKLVADAGGKVIVSKEKDSISNVETLLSELMLNRDTKDFIQTHVGGSIEKLIPIYRQVHLLSPERQRRISVEDILIRISPESGEIPPWEIEDPLFKGDLTKAISVARRVLIHSHPVLVLSILKNSLTRMHRIRSMTSSGVKDNKEIMKAAGNMSPAQVKFLTNRANRFSLQQTVSIVEIIADYEDRIKGKEPNDPYVQIEIMLVKIHSVIKG